MSKLTSNVSQAGSKHPDIALLKPRRRALAEDEVGGTLDQAVGVDLVASLAEESVLEASELAAVVSTVCVGAESNGLATLAVAIVDVDVVQLEVVGLDTQRARLVVAQAVSLRLGGRDGHDVVGVRGSVGRVPVDAELCGTSRHENLLRVGPRSDKDALGRRRRGRQGIHGRLDGGILGSRLANREA